MKKISDICKNIAPVHINDYSILSDYTAFLNASVFINVNDKPTFENVDLLFHNNKLVAIDFLNDDFCLNGTKLNVIDAKNMYITPTFIDQHIHGGFDVNFQNSSEEQIRYFLKQSSKFGYSHIVATLLPDSISHINKQLEVIKNIIDFPQSGSTKILGVHLEGPFFNPKKAAIHPPELLIKPNVSDFQKINNKNIIKIVTLAPELDENYKLCEFLNKHNIIPSAGHSIASAKDIQNSKVKQITHLFNAMAPIHHRELTIANEALSNDDLFIEIITDLKHVHPKMLNFVRKLKPKHKIIFISDALPCAYSKSNIFYMNNVKIDTSSGLAMGEDGTIAGNNKFSCTNIKQILNETDFTFEEITSSLSINCAKNLNIESKFEFKLNNNLDFMLWNKETLEIEKIFIS